MILSPGDRLGPYEVDELIGIGGMAEVYRGRDSRLGRPVAIKVLNDRGQEATDLPAQMLQEARAASALNHPNIVTVYDVGQHQARAFLVMEYLPGPSLEALLAKGPLAVRDAVRYALQVASGLGRAHAAGILHRDLKPANIMLTSDGAAKVVDFGIAKLTAATTTQSTLTSGVTRESSDGTRSSTTHGLKGSPAYMAPEQAQGLPVDPRSEIFSLGAVLYELVTGVRAFPGSWPDALRAVVSDTPRAPRELNAAVPSQLERLILDCLSKAPGGRPQTMEVVRERLQDVLEATDKRPTSVSWWESPARAAVAVALILVAAVLAVTRFRQTSPAAPPLSPLLTLPVTTDVGVEIQGSLSPDGRQVAFVSNAAGTNMDIYVKGVDSAAPALRLTTYEGRDVNPAWSPDGQWVLFVRRDSAGRGTVMRVAALGGAETVVTTACAAPDQFLSWSPDGAWFTCHGEPTAPGIYQVMVGTGHVNRLTAPPDGLIDTQAAVSPSGASMLFLRGGAAGLIVRDVYELRLSARGTAEGAPRLVLKLPLPPFRNLTWTPDGREAVVALAQADSLATKLYRLQVGESPTLVGPLHSGGSSAFEPTMGRSGRRLVFTEQGVQLDLGVSDAAGDRSHALSSTRLEFDPEYAPDGSRVAFVSDRSGRDEVWVALADGTRPARLTDLGAVGTPRWSPDGRMIAFVASNLETTKTDIFVINAEGGTPSRVTDGVGANQYPAFSRDGHWLYFTSSRTGREEIHRIDLATRAIEQVTAQGGMNAIEGPDGRRVIFQKRNPGGGNPERELWEIELDGRQERALGISVAYGTFALVPGGLLHIPLSEYGKPASMMRLLDLTTGATTDVRPLRGPVVALSARNMDTVLYTQSTTRFDLVRVDHFP